MQFGQILAFIGSQPLPRHFDDIDDAAEAREAEDNRLVRCALYRDEMRRALTADPTFIVATPAWPQRYTPAVDVVEDLAAGADSTLIRDLLNVARAAANGERESALIQARTLFAVIAEQHARAQARVAS